MVRLAAVALLLLAACAACASRATGLVDVSALPSHEPLTVLVFFSPGCHCLAAHDARLAALYERFHARGVGFFLVDSEVDASDTRDAQAAREHGYRFPFVLDRGAKLANAVGAEYASYTVILDGNGRIRYRGGIDSDKVRLHDDATPWLADALDDLLAGREPRRTESDAFGCALRRW
jgi:hypothetical protein